MRTVIASILIAALVVLLGGFAAIYAGVYDVAATEPHSPASWRPPTTSSSRNG